MIDTHAHLDFENFSKDREEVISRFFENGGKALINVGVDLETSRKSAELAEGYKNIFAAVGFHPHDANEVINSASGDDLNELKELAKHKKVVAIGEIGLDYSRFKEADQIEKQIKLFLAQIEIAKEFNLPIVIHCREAWNDMYEAIASFLRSNLENKKFTKFVLHCYSGNQKDTEKFLGLSDIYFSFSGNITYPKPIERVEQLAKVIKMIPLGRLMLDSDSPFLSPQAMRGKRNEPVYLRYVAEKIAEIKEISAEEAERVTDENAEKFFGI